MSRLEKAFFLYVRDREDIIAEWPLAQLLEEGEMEQFVSFYQAKLKASTNQAAATYFFGYFAYVMASLIDEIALGDETYDYSLHNLMVQMYPIPQYKEHGLNFKLVNGERSPIGEQRYERLSTFIQTVVLPVMNRFSAVTGMRQRELWGQMVLGLSYGAESTLHEAEHAGIVAEVEQTLAAIRDLHEAGFFEQKKHPLHYEFKYVTNGNGQQLKMKPTCCLYYTTEGAVHKCFTCPRLTKEERAARIH